MRPEFHMDLLIFHKYFWRNIAKFLIFHSIIRYDDAKQIDNQQKTLFFLLIFNGWKENPVFEPKQIDLEMELELIKHECRAGAYLFLKERPCNNIRPF